MLWSKRQQLSPYQISNHYPNQLILGLSLRVGDMQVLRLAVVVEQIWVAPHSSFNPQGGQADLLFGEPIMTFGGGSVQVTAQGHVLARHCTSAHAARSLLGSAVVPYATIYKTSDTRWDLSLLTSRMVDLDQIITAHNSCIKWCWGTRGRCVYLSPDAHLMAMGNTVVTPAALARIRQYLS